MPRGLHIALIGCGAMGRSMLDGWLANASDFSKIDVISHGLRQGDLPDPVNCYADLAAYRDAGITPDWYILAVKPYQLDEVCAHLSPSLSGDTAIISVAAGRSMASIRSHFSGDICVVRAMPNLPASIRRGVTGAYVDPSCDDRAPEAEVIMRAFGSVCWVGAEDDLHAVTALSGSGPAYLFHFCHLLQVEGEAMGLSPALSRQLAVEMLSGSAELMRVSDMPADQWRDKVAVPGGTTEAALAELDKGGGLRNLVRAALQAAVQRSKELQSA